MAAAAVGPVASASAADAGNPVAALTAGASAFLASPNPSAPAAGSAPQGNSAPAQGGSPAAQGGSAAGAVHPIPGTDAAIQRWFLNNGAVKVRFNDALLRAEKAVAAGDATGCQPLDAGTRALLAVLPPLGGLSPAGQKLAAAMQTPLTTFATAATACLAKDFSAAQSALDTGVAQQADAQARIDEILDGDL